MVRFEQFLDPERIELGGKVFYVSRVPALLGRELVMQYTASAIPKIGDYQTNEAMALKMLERCAVEVTPGADPVPLSTRELIDNHVDGWETLMQLEGRMIAKNCSFFADGRASTFFADIVETAKSWGIQMLTRSLEQFAAKDSQRSTNSGRSTT